MAGLAGRVAIVTGAARGIGQAIAERVAADGASVLMNDIQAERLASTVAELREKGCEVLGVPGDVTRPDDVRQMVEAAAARWGRIDVLVNNAGIGGTGKTLLELGLDEWRQMIDADLTSVFICCRAVLPYMLQQGRGCIVNLSSITGLMGVAGSSHYAAAKAGVVGFSKALSKEVAQHRINVNVVAPGLIDTEMSRARGIDHQRSLVLWPRIGAPNDVAGVVAFLASDDAEFITGQVLGVNGGAYM